MSIRPDPQPSSFDLLAQRSEQTRILLVIAVVVALLILACFRRFAGDLVMNSRVFPWSQGLLVLALVYESWLLVITNRANHAGRLIGEFRWRANTVIETMFAIGVLLISFLLSPRGEVAALSAPPMLAFPLLTLLSVLRLRPSFTLWSGLLGAAAHGLLALRTYEVSGYDNSRLPIYLSYTVMLALIAAAGALVARRVRDYVEFAVQEEAELKRVQLVARNTLIFGLAKLAEYRDTDTGAHLERISVYCTLLARAMATDHPFIDDDWIHTLSVASSMHDIGKVGIPDAVLLKPGRLTDDERTIIQKHPQLGHRVLAEILARNGGDALLQMSAEIAAHHHERWDGTGYPDRLAATSIPMPARIVSVADVYDALTSKRVYKPAMSHTEASKIINDGSGTQFDPTVVVAFSSASSAFDQARQKLIDGP